MIQSFCANISTRCNNGIQSTGNIFRLKPEQYLLAKKVITVALVAISLVAATSIHWSLGLVSGVIFACVAISPYRLIAQSNPTDQQPPQQQPPQQQPPQQQPPQQQPTQQQLPIIEKLVVDKTDTHSPVYSLDDVVQKVKAATEKGLKVGLVFGREPSGPLPKEIGWDWFSLGDEDEELHDHHLLINFNKKEEMAKAKRLFDKVIVTLSTIKFMDSQKYNTRLENLTSLLKIGPQTELITEAVPIHYCYKIKYQLPEGTKSHYQYQDFAFIYNKKEFYDRSIEKPETVKCMNKAKEMYEKIFDHAELKIGDIYPIRPFIPGSLDSEDFREPYWVLKGLKDVQIPQRIGTEKYYYK